RDQRKELLLQCDLLLQTSRVRQVARLLGVDQLGLEGGEFDLRVHPLAREGFFDSAQIRGPGRLYTLVATAALQVSDLLLNSAAVAGRLQVAELLHGGV